MVLCRNEEWSDFMKTWCVDLLSSAQGLSKTGVHGKWRLCTPAKTLPAAAMIATLGLGLVADAAGATTASMLDIVLGPPVLGGDGDGDGGDGDGGGKFTPDFGIDLTYRLYTDGDLGSRFSIFDVPLRVGGTYSWLLSVTLEEPIELDDYVDTVLLGAGGGGVSGDVLVGLNFDSFIGDPPRKWFPGLGGGLGYQIPIDIQSLEDVTDPVDDDSDRGSGPYLDAVLKIYQNRVLELDVGMKLLYNLGTDEIDPVGFVTLGFQLSGGSCGEACLGQLDIAVEGGLEPASVPLTPVPAPAALPLLGCALAGLWTAARRRR